MSEQHEPGEVSEAIIDLEQQSRHGESPGHCRGYRVRVNDKHIVVNHGVVTGREILELSGFCPPEDHCLRLRIRGNQPRLVELDTQIDLTVKGTERFFADKLRLIAIKLNERELVVNGPKATGLEIKEAAIKSDIAIQLDFVLSIELANGRTKIIGDCDLVFIEEGACFIAVAPDDNS